VEVTRGVRVMIFLVILMSFYDVVVSFLELVCLLAFKEWATGAYFGTVGLCV